VAVSREAVERWMYRKGGMDFGPCSTHEVEDQIRRREFDEGTEICSVRSRKFEKIGDIPHFRRFIDVVLVREAEEAGKAAVIQEAVALEKKIASKGRLPLLILAAVVGVGGGVGGYFAMRSGEATAGWQALNVFRDMRFDHLVLFKAASAEPAKVAAASDAAAKKAVRRVARPRVPGAPGALAGVEGEAMVMDEPVEVDLSGDEPEGANGRQITTADLDSVQRRASPGLVRCFRDEAARIPEFKGGTALLLVRKKGDVVVSRLNTNPGPSATLINCARGATGGARVAPFVGSDQVMELPIYVQGIR